MIRCFNCHKDIALELGQTPHDDWWKIANYLNIELTQGEITDLTYETLMDALQGLRPKVDKK